MDAKQAFDQRDAKKTIAFQDHLLSHGRSGQVAFGLFRASKRSNRAKDYRRSLRSSAYEAKNNALEFLDAALGKWGEQLGITSGWNMDPGQPVYKCVFYVDIPGIGQASFHSMTTQSDRVYRGDWSGKRNSHEIIQRYCQSILDQPELKRPATGDDLCPFGKHGGKELDSLDTGYLQWLAQWEGIKEWENIGAWIGDELLRRPPSPQVTAAHSD